MSAPLSLTDRDRELLIALDQKVRVFTQRQIARRWFADDMANTRRRLKQLVEAGLINRVGVMARPLPKMERPVMTWRTDMSAPDVHAVSYQLQQRWKGAVRHCSTFVATERLSQMFGGKRTGELRQPIQVTHDLGVAQIWLVLSQIAPEWAAAWRGEDLLAHTRAGQKCPDAFIVNGDQQVVAVMEFGGAYHADRVREFHDDCAARQLPYQIW